MSQEGPSVLGGVLVHPTKLASVEDSKADSVKLQAIGEHLLDKLVQRVKEHNWAKGLWDVISRLSRFGDDHCLGGFEGPWPITHCKAGIGNSEEYFVYRRVQYKTLEVPPGNVIRPGC